MNDQDDDKEQDVEITPNIWKQAKEMAQYLAIQMNDQDDDKEQDVEITPNMWKHAKELAQHLAFQMKDPDKLALAKRMIAPISKPRHYALQGKLLAHSLGVQVEISEAEWKQAEELGLIEPETTDDNNDKGKP